MKYVTTLILSLLTLLCNAQTGRLFTTDKELSSSLINEIREDRSGMVWIATENGLNRFDGCKITVYKHDDGDEYSLSHNLVRSIFEDSRGNLFVGTYSGVQLYDPAADRFSRQAVREDGTPFACNIECFMERANGELWVMGSELCSLEIRNGEPCVSPVVLPHDAILNETVRMHEGRDGYIWICRRHGITRIAPDRSVRIYQEQSKGMIITDIAEDAAGHIYIGTTGRGGGLLVYDPVGDGFMAVPCDGNRALSVKDLYYIGETDEFLIATDGEGVKSFSPEIGYVADNPLINSQLPPPIGAAKVHSVIKDSVGNIWLAVYQRGVAVVPSVANSFRYLGHRSVDGDIIGSNCITSFCRDHEGTMWIGTDNDGVYGITPELSCRVHYAPTESVQSVPPTILKLYEDSRRTLWVGSFTRGLGVIDRRSGRCTYRRDLQDNRGNSVQPVFDLVEDNDGRLWIATMGAGLFWYDLRSDKIYSREQREDEYINSWMTCLLHSSDNKLYIGTYDGAFCIDLSTPELRSSQIRREMIIFSMYEDRSGTVWMGSSAGLFGWNPATQTLDACPMGDVACDVVYAICGDERNDLWLSTNNGLLRFDMETRSFVHYLVEDGLQGNEFSKNAAYCDRSGELWFGGMNGVTWFDPQEIINPARKWDIRITDFYLHNRPVHRGVLSGGREIVDCPVFEADRFMLAHGDNSFTVEFATVGFSNSGYITYSYSLGDDKWTILPAGSSRVSFSNLPSGIYRFRVRAADHTMQSNTREITVQIRPAWWETWWAKLLYAVLAVGAAVLLYLYFSHRNALRQKMLEHIHAKQIDEAKLQFFINVSHEIRTPLSLIISPLHKLMESDGDEEHRRLYRIVQRNADRIMLLVNQLMDIDKIGKGQMSLRFRETDAVRFIGDLCQSFAPVSHDKHIDLQFRHDGLDELKLWVSPDYFDKMLMNILSNAFKFTPEGGRIEVRLLREQEGGFARIEITDTGRGIDPAELEHIFERFYQAKNNPLNIGTGIGLHLTRSLADLHHGSVHAENNPDGAGSRFVIRLPLGNAHLRPEEMDTESTGEIRRTVPRVWTGVPADEMQRSAARTKYRLLVVEDDPEIRNYICQELSSEFRIIESTNGREGLECIFKQAPDLIVSDIMMPEMDGLELCAKVKQNINLNSIPVILLTARAEETDRLDGLDTGADAYIAKPFNIEVLRRTANNLIRNRERLRNAFGKRQIDEEKLKRIEVQSPDEKLMERVMRVINDNIDNPELSVEMIATTVGISRVHLHRKLKELTNQTTRDFIRNVRLKQASVLMREKRYPINEIARLTGFNDPNNFATAFKKLYGVTPVAYMNGREE